MKQITNKTVLKQGDKTFQPVEVDGVIYWITEKTTDIIDGHFYHPKNVIFPVTDTYIKGPISSGIMSKVVAQSQPKLKGVPVISLIKSEYHYTQKDIERAIELARVPKKITFDGDELTGKIIRKHLTKEEILEQTNSISVIQVDEQFNAVSYE